MSWVNAVDVFTVVKNPMSDWIEQVDDSSLANESYIQGTVNDPDSVNFGFGDFVKGLFYFILSFGLGIVAVPYTLSQFGVIFPFNYLVGLPVYLIYFAAISQIIANRAYKSMT